MPGQHIGPRKKDELIKPLRGSELSLLGTGKGQRVDIGAAGSRGKVVAVDHEDPGAADGNRRTVLDLVDEAAGVDACRCGDEQCEQQHLRIITLSVLVG